MTSYEAKHHVPDANKALQACIFASRAEGSCNGGAIKRKTSDKNSSATADFNTGSHCKAFGHLYEET